MNKAHVVRLLVLAFAVFAGVGVFQLVKGLRDSGHCPTEPHIGDGGFLSGDPCGPPCFLGIIPNVTREMKALDLLREKGLYKYCYVFDDENSPEGGGRGAYCPNVGITYVHGTDMVEAIGYCPSQRLTVEMAIEKHGEPDAVWVGTTWDSSQSYLTTRMELLFTDGDTVSDVDLGERRGDTFTVEPSTILNWIYYSNLSSETEDWVASWSSWHGYGSYQEQPQE